MGVGVPRRSTVTTPGAPYRNQVFWLLGKEDGQVARAEAFHDPAADRAVIENHASRADQGAYSVRSFCVSSGPAGL
jgi:hypothetical protein